VVQLFWNKERVESFNGLLQRVPNDVLNSPRRSVVPLLDFSRDPANALARIGSVTHLDLAPATDMIFEHAVPVQRGRGKASFTDLLILSPKAAVAVEAKYTEPEYETVKSWLGESKPNREDVLSGWLSLLERVSNRPLRATDVAELPYQLVHRAASVCHCPHQKRVMLYLVFGEPAAHYAKHIASLAALIGPGLSLLVANCPVAALDRFRELEQRWARGERELGPDVRAALVAAPLFSFGDLSVVY
jgi:hypothetical protein